MGQGVTDHTRGRRLQGVRQDKVDGGDVAGECLADEVDGVGDLESVDGIIVSVDGVGLDIHV